MPLYEYACKKCNKHFEIIQNIGTKSTQCPACGSECRKLISSTSFQLKGSGWYKTDYKSSNSGSSSSKSSHSNTCSCCHNNSDGKCGI
ncbi:MAG: zinc ribbon domain-containing protein [Proteobacteria bacterium]|nr:zinc ribbon domain-containing protein [Pseudomonadota bacterium]